MSALRGSLLVLIAAPAWAQEVPSSGQQLHDVPAKYFVNYPAAERFCPPIRMAFADAASTLRTVRNKVVQVDPNGGYGLAYDIRGRSLFHTGADIGWFREGEPVFAIADGVVRSSDPGIRAMAAQAGRRLPGGPIDYGNLIIIEHRTPDGEFFCSLYGHLGDDRQVAAGDLVTAGQLIGSIGRKAAIVNGGYEPHLHFGIRSGAMFKPGDQALDLQIAGEQTSVRIVELGEDQVRLSLTPDPGVGFTMMVGDRRIEAAREDGTYLVPSWTLHNGAAPGTSFAGYASSLEGWRDPIAYLRTQGATNPPPAMLVTSCRDDDFDRKYVLREPAPSWTVAEWLRPNDRPDLDVGDFADKVVAVFCFDPRCRASQTHGLPTLRSVAGHFNGDPDVAVVGLLTPTGRRHPPRTERRELASHLPPQISLGYCGKPRETPEILDAYQVCGTPWIVLIDKGGIVQFSNYTVRAEEIIRRVGELKSR